ncbi:oxygen-dependent coproporphyrinogen oxidase [Marinoscillum pacificum]|uniref:oxygen-dependent coproporphyrinogen oxidase n=1 Tax=Marinoscillum pacificum TaxID=392723 RepID=UPI0021581A41|nr:oxygen-dependent coproporphyrinogen oxidase [Marinoscillum pacificum]
MRSKETITERFKVLQDSICSSLEQLDGRSTFHEDLWARDNDGGGGRSRVITNGNLIEKGGVNFSAVHGDLPEKIQNALGFGPSTFYATGVSIVLHPKNPWVPIIHMNVRYFETEGKEGDESTYWFGGGIDLTPHYVTADSGKFIHTKLKEVCDQTDAKYYPKFKKWADDYFFIKHRDETRGVGGIFYDHLNESKEQKSFDELWAFHQGVGEAFVPIYKHYADLHRNKPYTEENLHWQRVRRGRYVEFNLVWDRGTKFGLDTNGRTESILMSMPPQADWLYDYKPDESTPEGESLKWLKKDIDWLADA